MRHHRRLPLLLVILGLLAAACGDAVQTASADTGGTITTRDTSIGTVLADGDGLTLYGLTDDTEGVSTCYDACATTWPPTPGGQAAGDGVAADLFTTVDRDDGGDQLAAGDIPLYTFAGDAAAGDVNGQGSGGVWFAVAADGTLVDGGPRPAASDAPAAADAAPEVAEAVLTDAEGLTLYYFRNDADGTSVCNAPCSDTWPPVPADAQIDTSALQLARLGSTTRDDGTGQLTYARRPLYTYVDDAAPGDVNGQGVGDVWFAVAVDGDELAPAGVRIGSTDAGEVVVDGDGFTLYTFANDGPGASVCKAPCSDTWPPVPADATIDTGAVAQAAFGAVTRDDGTQQLAIGDQPLYRFTGDANPGDANGDGVGDVWFVVAADQVEAAAGDADADDGYGAGQRHAAGLAVADTDLGPTLVDGDGSTLYAFLNDAEGQSTCDDACADAWPPLAAGLEVDDAVAGPTTTITRTDGSTQLAIGGRPLYRFSGDRAPGDINGQGSGDVWFAVAPDGQLYR